MFLRGSQGTYRADPCRGYDGKSSPVPPVTFAAEDKDFSHGVGIGLALAGYSRIGR